jgi:hypothetical protein
MKGPAHTKPCQIPLDGLYHTKFLKETLDEIATGFGAFEL